MILRGAQIHRDGHGKCGLLSNPTLSSSNIQLLFAGALASTRMSFCGSIVSLHHFTPGDAHISNSKDRKLFHVTRARCRVVRLPRA
jgi:hypothetical protein